MFWFWLLLPPFIVGLFVVLGGALQGSDDAVSAGMGLCVLCAVIVIAANAVTWIGAMPAIPQ